jgi:hypothetical protein
MSNGGPYSWGSSIQTYVNIQATDEMYSRILDAGNAFAGEVIKGDVSTDNETAGKASDGDAIWQRILTHGPQQQLSFSVRTLPY